MMQAMIWVDAPMSEWGWAVGGAEQTYVLHGDERMSVVGELRSTDVRSLSQIWVQVLDRERSAGERLAIYRAAFRGILSDLAYPQSDLYLWGSVRKDESERIQKRHSGGGTWVAQSGKPETRYVFRRVGAGRAVDETWWPPAAPGAAVVPISGTDTYQQDLSAALADHDYQTALRLTMSPRFTLELLARILASECMYIWASRTGAWIFYPSGVDLIQVLVPITRQLQTRGVTVLLSNGLEALTYWTKHGSPPDNVLELRPVEY